MYVTVPHDLIVTDPDCGHVSVKPEESAKLFPVVHQLLDWCALQHIKVPKERHACDGLVPWKVVPPGSLLPSPKQP
jgi:hypothetical protein